MNEQLDMVFTRPLATDPAVVDLVEFLRGKGWMTRRQISAATSWNERTVRELASQADAVISYPGSPGYRLLADCTVDEYHAYRNARLAQSREMARKVIRTDRIFFRRTPAVV